MTSAIRRRFSYNSSGDKEFRRPYVSQSRRLSADSCGTYHQQQNRQQENVSISGRNHEDCASVNVLSPRSKAAGSPEEYKRSPNRSLLEQTKGDVKPILKKQSSDVYNYASLLSLVCPGSNSRDNISRGTDNSSTSTASSSLSSAHFTTGRQQRRVRFSESVSFIDDGYNGEGVRKVLGEISNEVVLDDGSRASPALETDRDTYCTGQLITMTPTCMERARLPERKLSESVPIESVKCKKELKSGPIPKRSKLSSTNFSFPKPQTVAKSAWGKVNVSSSCDNIPALNERRNKGVKSTNRSLERSKTTMGSVDYSSIKSKLRTMGFFDSNRKLNSSRPVTVNVSETFERPDSGRSQRLAHNYSTFREELYTIGDYEDKDDAVSVKYMSSTSPTNGCFRSLGDEYARFLKGRYSVDDVTCS